MGYFAPSFSTPSMESQKLREGYAPMGLKVLYVDDEPELLNVFRNIVEPLGYEVVTLADSREAAERIQQDKFDGVVLDACMPQPDGFELTRLVRSSPPNAATPVVMLSGSTDPETMGRGFKAGVTFFFGKPITQTRLAGLLRVVHGAMARERRGYDRLPFRTMVTCYLGERIFESQCVNISRTGMLLAKAAGVGPGEIIDLEFALPRVTGPLRIRATVIRKLFAKFREACTNAAPLRTRGRVIRKLSPDGMAVQFIGLKDPELSVIQQYVSAKSPK